MNENLGVKTVFGLKRLAKCLMDQKLAFSAAKLIGPELDSIGEAMRSARGPEKRIPFPAFKLQVLALQGVKTVVRRLQLTPL